MQFVIVTGMSGSGKSSCIEVLEDMGYYCIDNMPPELIGKFVDICNQSESKIEKVAFVIDIRSGELFSKLKDVLTLLRDTRPFLFGLPGGCVWSLLSIAIGGGVLLAKHRIEIRQLGNSLGRSL